MCVCARAQLECPASLLIIAVPRASTNTHTHTQISHVQRLIYIYMMVVVVIIISYSIALTHRPCISHSCCWFVSEQMEIMRLIWKLNIYLYISQTIWISEFANWYSRKRKTANEERILCLWVKISLELILLAQKFEIRGLKNQDGAKVRPFRKTVNETVVVFAHILTFLYTSIKKVRSLLWILKKNAWNATNSRRIYQAQWKSTWYISRSKRISIEYENTRTS